MVVDMKVGKYQIGRYHGIIKAFYEDGSYDYETSFSDEEDIRKSIYAVRQCIGRVCGTATDNPRKLIDMQVIRGKEAIIEELEKEQNLK